MIQGKSIYNFGIPERLRTLRYSIFTGGVVEENGIAAPLSTKARRCGRAAGSPSPSRLTPCHTPPFVAARHLPPERGKSFLKGRALGITVQFPIQVQSVRFRQSLSLWERWHGASRDGEGEDAYGGAHSSTPIISQPLPSPAHPEPAPSSVRPAPWRWWHR